MARGLKESSQGPKKKKETPQEAPINLRGFLAKAGAPELLELARNTALVGHPLVKEYDNAKEQALRKLLYHEQKKHADFRNRLASLVREKTPTA